MEVNQPTPFRRVATRISRSVYYLGMLMLLGLMGLVVADVTGRFAFNNPLLGALDAMTLMLLIIIFSALAYTQAMNEHVSVDFITSKLKPRARAIVDSITGILATVVVGILAWQSFVQAVTFLVRDQRSPDLWVVLFPFQLFLAIGFTLLFLMLLVDLTDWLKVAFAGNHPGSWIALVFGVSLTLLAAAAAMFHWLPWEISPAVAGGIGIGILLVLLFSGMPVAYTLATVGYLGLSYLSGVEPAFTLLRGAPFEQATSFGLIVIPLFTLMGEFVAGSGMGRGVYEASYKWLGNLPGGLAMATIGGCAGFAAVTGSNVACAATMGAISLPEMKRYKYNDALATGAVAAGGTLGVMIPPSITFIIYALVTEQSIGRLFLAGVIPGVILAIMMMISIYIRCRFNINLGPPGPRTIFREKLTSLQGVWPILIMFVVVIGGIYGGVFTPYEAGGIGAFVALLFGLGYRSLSPKKIAHALIRTGVITNFSIFMLIGASMIGTFLAVTRLPFTLASYVATLPLPPLAILTVILLIFLILGCFLPNLAVILIAVPLFFPIVINLGHDPIWFGVVIVLLAEIAVTTPPVGIVSFVVKGVAGKDVSMATVFRGVFPFILVELVFMAILIAFPDIATFLPSLMKG